MFLVSILYNLNIDKYNFKMNNKEKNQLNITILFTTSFDKFNKYFNSFNIINYHLLKLIIINSGI